MVKSLITGSTGCLGQRLALDLLAKNHQVIAHGRDAKATATLRRYGADILLADLRSGVKWEDLQGVDVVYHCAALSSAWGKTEDFMAVNVKGTSLLLTAAKKAGVRKFIFASSPSIYANGEDRFNLAEDAPLSAHFSSPYAKSKFLAERLVLEANDPDGMRTITIRPRAIYGKGDRSLMPRLLTAIKRGRVPMISAGQSQIDITHVSDAARAMICAAQADTSGGKAYNITSGEIWRFEELLDAVCKLTNATPKRINLSYGTAMNLAKMLETFHHIFMPSREPVLSTQVVASLGRSLTLDITRARKELDYHPQVTLSEGIKDYSDVV
ncbi:NAD-dependent epimerase/dehydratase family protein [Brucellaceae bacterium C25G]